MQTSRVGFAVSSFLGFGSRPKPPQNTNRQPAALPRPLALPAAQNPPAASAPVKPAVPAAGGVDDPLVRTRVEKHGGAIAPNLAGHPSTLGSSAEVPLKAPVEVKAHVRNLPAQAAAEKSLIVEPVTLDTLIAEFRKAQRITVQRVLLLGALCERWIRQQLSERTALDRATAIKKIRETLAEARLEKKEARVDLYVHCHWAAVLLGGWRDDSQESRAASNELSFSALRLFPVLLERDRATDRWRLIDKYAEAARSLWTRAIKEHLSAAAVDEELSKILPARTLPIRKHRPVKIGFVLKLVPRLPVADLDTLIARAQELRRESLLPSEAKAG